MLRKEKCLSGQGWGQGVVISLKENPLTCLSHSECVVSVIVVLIFCVMMTGC